MGQEENRMPEIRRPNRTEKKVSDFDEKERLKADIKNRLLADKAKKANERADLQDKDESKGQSETAGETEENSRSEGTKIPETVKKSKESAGHREGLTEDSEENSRSEGTKIPEAVKKSKEPAGHREGITEDLEENSRPEGMNIPETVKESKEPVSRREGITEDLGENSRSEGKKSLKLIKGPEETAEQKEGIEKDSEEQQKVDGAKGSKMKQKPKKSLGNILLLCIGIIMIGYALWSIGSLLWDYSRSNQLYDELNNDFVTILSDQNAGQDGDGVKDQDWSESVVWYERIQVDLAGVQKKNSDVVGWLYQEGEGPISYPILYSGDNTSYLRTALDGSPATAGCIFVEGKNNPDLNDSHTIIYGHNMRNGSMFGTLSYLKTQEDYFQEHQYFQIFLPDEIRRYQVFAYEIVEPDAWVYQIPFGANQEFADFISMMYDKSETSTDITVTENDKIITFSTCSGSGSTKRFVVHAVWVDTYDYATGTTWNPREQQTSDVQSTASKNTKDKSEEPEMEFLAQ